MTNLVRWPLLLGLSFIAAGVAACGGGGPGGPNSSDDDVGVFLMVQRSTPTSGQEVQGNLIDAGEEQDAGKITLLFSERLDPATILDPNNAFNGLTSDVNVLNAAFQRVAGTPRITGPRGNILEFVPAGNLPNQQYTITVSRDVLSAFGDRLNGGAFDYHTGFTVGPDVYGPVIRQTYPAPFQKDVAKDSKIIVTFTEPIAPNTANTGTMTVFDGGTNPPTQINGTVTLSQDRFSVIFTPDPTTPMPANSTMVVTVFGGNSGLKDDVSNVFDGDPADATNENYVFSFETVKEPPLPIAPLPWSNNPPQAGVYVGTFDGRMLILDETPFLANQNDLTLWAQNNPVLNSPTQLVHNGNNGRAFNAILDPRFNPVNGHTWLYVSDVNNRVLHVMSTMTNRVVHTFTGLPDPRGLSVDGAGRLFVTNTSANTVTMIRMQTITPVGTLGVSDAMKLLDKIPHRNDLDVGQGPLGAAVIRGTNLLGVANSLDSTFSLVDIGQWKQVSNFPIGENPYDVDGFTVPGVGSFAFITCRGGDTNAGSLSLWWSQYAQSMQSDLSGFNHPMGLTYDGNISVWVANFGANTAAKAQLAVVGGGFYPTILASIASTVEVGNSPVDVIGDPFFFGLTGAPLVMITADQGSSQATFFYNNSPAETKFSLPIPGISVLTGVLDR